MMKACPQCWILQPGMIWAKTTNWMHSDIFLASRSWLQGDWCHRIRRVDILCNNIKIEHSSPRQVPSVSMSPLVCIAVFLPRWFLQICSMTLVGYTCISTRLQISVVPWRVYVTLSWQRIAKQGFTLPTKHRLIFKLQWICPSLLRGVALSYILFVVFSYHWCLLNLKQIRRYQWSYRVLMNFLRILIGQKCKQTIKPPTVIGHS